jgi:hypothetical protein
MGPTRGGSLYPSSFGDYLPTKKVVKQIFDFYEKREYF